MGHAVMFDLCRTSLCSGFANIADISLVVFPLLYGHPRRMIWINSDYGLCVMLLNPAEDSMNSNWCSSNAQQWEQIKLQCCCVVDKL